MGRNLARIMLASLLFATIGSAALVPSVAAAEVCFPETGKSVGDRFYRYWEEHGGLAQQGYSIIEPISETVTAEGPLKGKKLTVQYFERARLEYHPKNADPQCQVLLVLLGDEQFRAK